MATTALHDLVRNNDVDGVRSYIAMGRDLNTTDKLHRTGLHLAAWAGHLEILQMLIRAKADSSIKAMDAFTILHFAATSNAPNIAACIEFIGKKARAIIHQRSTKGLKSALHIAIPKGRLETIQALLEIGLDPLAKTSQGLTAVELAKQSKQSAVYELIVSFAENRGKQLNDSDQTGDSDEGSEEEEEKVKGEISDNNESNPNDDNTEQSLIGKKRAREEFASAEESEEVSVPSKK